jgi:6,7-dimethyl-8-ribityllumazine synthase
MASNTDPKNKLLHIETGIQTKKNAFVVLVKTEWNASIVDELEKGCISELKKNSVKKIISITVPGAFEIPFAVKRFWDTYKKSPSGRKGKRPDAFIALGCIIRGETPHFDYIAKAVTEGVVQLNLILPVPTIFGVLTVENEVQAKDRIGGKHGHNGERAAITAIKMINLHPQTLK